MLRHQSIVTKRYSRTVTYAGPQAVRHMHACRERRPRGLPASKSDTRKRRHYVLSGQASFDELSCKDAALAGEKLWAPREGRQRPDQSGGGKHCRRDGRIGLGEDGLCKYRLFQVISVITQVVGWWDRQLSLMTVSCSSAFPYREGNTYI